MRVLVFAESFGTVTKTFIYNEVISLAPHAEVWVLTNSRGNAELVKYQNVIEIPWKRNWIAERLHWEMWKHDIWFGQSNRSFKKSLAEVIEKVKPDVIHCHFGNEAIKLTDNLDRIDIPVIVTFHGYDATQFDNIKCYRRKLIETFNRKNIYPMFVSKHIRNRVEMLGVDVSKGFLHYLGIDLDRFKRTMNPAKENGIQFVQVSAFTSQKGHPVTIAAIKKFIESYPEVPVKFIFGGAGGDELDVVTDLVKKNNLQESIIFTGRLTPVEVRDLLEQSHIFIHHSIAGFYGETEGLPTAIMEAMAMELPILSTWHAGIPELVQDGINGLLVQENDVDTYVEKMKEIINWNYLPHNRERVVEMCELKNHAVKLVEIYKTVISQTAKSKS